MGTRATNTDNIRNHRPLYVDRRLQFWSNAPMARLPIKYFPDPILREVTSEIAVFDAVLHTLLDNMYETMVHSDGLGLAAPQVGCSERLAIIDLTIEGMPQPFITSLSGHAPDSHIHEGRLELINPHISAKSARLASSEEGCLSIPSFRDSIKRHENVSVEAQDRHGRAYALEATELLSFALQHEIDHLDGVLFIDHLSRLKKVLFKKWCIKNEFDLET